MSPQGRRCQIYVSCKQTLLHIYGNLLSLTLSHCFQWRLRIVCLIVWLALLCQVNSHFNFLLNFVCWLHFYYISISKSHRSQRVSCKMFRPRARSFTTSLEVNYGIKCWNVVNKQHSHICVPLVKMGKSSVQGEGNCIVICTHNEFVLVTEASGTEIQT